MLLQGRVDQDEDASTKQPGDVEGQLGPLTLPARSLTVVLETVRKEGSGPPADSTFGHGAMPPEHGSLPPGHNAHSVCAKESCPRTHSDSGGQTNLAADDKALESNGRKTSRASVNQTPR